MKIYFFIITGITFTLFFSEALIHFNIGRNGEGEPTSHKYVRLGNRLTFHIPDKSEFFKIFITVLLFSSLSGFLSAYVLKRHIMK